MNIITAMNQFFVKSFEEDYSTKTLVGRNKKTFQTLENILSTKIIKPNTKSFGQEMRLCTTILTENYTKTYRPQGMIFETKTKPAYILPFDLVLLSDAKKIVVHYYRIKDNLHIYYNHKLISGYKNFIFKDISTMIEKYNSPKVVWHELNDFRSEHGYQRLPKSKYRLAEYNEATFLNPLKISPVALFGYRAKTKQLAKKFNLKYYKSAKEFYERTHRTESI